MLLRLCAEWGAETKKKNYSPSEHYCSVVPLENGRLYSDEASHVYAKAHAVARVISMPECFTLQHKPWKVEIVMVVMLGQ